MIAKVVSIFGSDVYERYTAIYTWQTNQMAHAMMGFAFASLLILDAKLLGCSAWWGLAFIALPIAKDVTDLLVDLAKPRNAFPAPLGEMIVDAAADDSYWFSGVAGATAVAVQLDTQISTSTKGWLWVAIILFVVATIVWTKGRFGAEKRRLDGAMLPYYTRLPNIGSPIAGDQPALIERFLETAGNTAGTTRHLVVTGDADAGKTELAVAIGSELIVARASVRYETALKFYDYVEAGRPSRPLAKNEPIFVQDASVLIVDDVEAPPAPAAPAGPIAVKAMPTPGFVTAIALNQTKAERWVWVLDDPHTAMAWQGFLAATFGPAAVVETVTLQRAHRSPTPAIPLRAKIAAMATLGASALLIVATVALIMRDLMK